MSKSTIKTPTASVKTLGEFEATHGQPRMRRLERELENERRKLHDIAAARKPVTVIKSDANTIKFGVIGDPHFGSLYNYADGLRAFYDACAREGVREVLCAGDVLAGWRMYKGQEFELEGVGLDQQIEIFAERAPVRDGIATRFITGNHDGSFAALVGVEVGEKLAAARKDWIYEAAEQATIRYTTPAGVYDVMLLHPGGGTAYALSYKPQKIIEQMEGGTKPNMVCIGHFHKAEMLPSYRNICAIQTGTFEWQTPFMVRKSLAAHVGGWIVEATVGESWNVVKAAFIAFYR